MRYFGRRDFLKSSILGASGLAMANRPAVAGSIGTDRPVITRTLGKTGLELPVISMGVMNADNPGLLRLAYEKGIKHFDSAHSYQGGNNEKMCGEFFRNKPRDSYVISTKVLPPGLDWATGQIGNEFAAETYISMFETSLKRLQIDYVDIFYQHVVSREESVLRDDVLGAMQKMKDQGKARFIGVSTHNNQEEVIRAATRSNIYDVVLVGYNFMQDNHAEISRAMAEGAAAGMGYIGMKTMAGGFLDEEKTKPVNPVAALKWVLQDPSICTCIPGFTAYDHIETDLEVMYDITLTPGEKSELVGGQEYAGLFCQGCNACEKQCSRGYPVPDLMRSYMYAYGYSDLKKARQVLETRGIDVNPCEGCFSCNVKCARNFPVSDRISKIARLMAVPDDFIV